MMQESFKIFKELGVGMVITDTAGRGDCVHQCLTTSIAFIRFVGNQLHSTDYARIDSWINCLKSWIEKGGKEVYFFVHQHEEQYTPELVNYLNKCLKESLKINFNSSVKPIVQQNKLF